MRTGPAAFQGNVLAVEAISDERRGMPGRRLHDLVEGERRLEHLGRVIIVKAPEVDPPDVADLAKPDDQFPERHSLPQSLAQRRGDVVALHGLEVLDAMCLCPDS